MSGMEMMLRNMLGIDPAEIKRQVDTGAKQLSDFAKNTHDAISRIESVLEKIVADQDAKFSTIFDMLEEDAIDRASFANALSDITSKLSGVEPAGLLTTNVDPELG